MHIGLVLVTNPGVMALQIYFYKHFVLISRNNEKEMQNVIIIFTANTLSKKTIVT